MQPTKILFIDIETSPLITYTWGLHDQNIGLNQITKDWEILSYAAKYRGEKEVYYRDQRDNKTIKNDKKLLKEIWKLLDNSDIVVTQNGISFDHKRINAKFIEAGMKPPSSYKTVDTLKIARKYFGFTSNKLEYMTKMLCTQFKKSSHKKFPGMKLWDECMKGNPEAWREMESYNKMDILSLEELFEKLSPWDNSYNPNLYTNHELNMCKCGSIQFKRNGYHFTSTGKYQRYKCLKCGSETRDRKNLFSKEKLKSLRVRTK